MVFQNYALYPHMSVADNMGFALKIAGVNKAEIRQKVEEAAKILDLTEYLDRKPKALSGGQRQRVAMGRAIVREPQVFLMDEPLSNLDAKLRVQTRTQIATPAAPPRHHHRLRHPRPGRGHDHGRPGGGPQGRSAAAGRHRRATCTTGRPTSSWRASSARPAMNLVEVPITDGGVKFGNSVVPVYREALTAAADKGDRTVTVGVRPEHFDIVETTAPRKSLSKDRRRPGRSRRHRQRRRGARRRRLRLRLRRGRRRGQGPGHPRRRPPRAGEGRRAARRAAAGRDPRLLHLHRGAPQRLTRMPRARWAPPPLRGRGAVRVPAAARSRVPACCRQIPGISVISILFVNARSTRAASIHPSAE